MTAKEMIKALRICGNHPSMDGYFCGDCPWEPKCEGDLGGAGMALEAAEILETLLAENESRRTQDPPEECFGGMA